MLAEAFAEHGGLVDAALVRRELLRRYGIHVAPPESSRRRNSGGLTVNIGQINGPVYNSDVMNIYDHRPDH